MEYTPSRACRRLNGDTCGVNSYDRRIDNITGKNNHIRRLCIYRINEPRYKCGIIAIRPCMQVRYLGYTVSVKLLRQIMPYNLDLPDINIEPVDQCSHHIAKNTMIPDRIAKYDTGFIRCLPNRDGMRPIRSIATNTYFEKYILAYV